VTVVPELYKFFESNPGYPAHFFAGLPVFFNESMAGALMASFDDEYIFKEADMNLMRCLCSVIAVALERE